MNISKNIPCVCGSKHLTLTFRDGMPPEVVDRVFCPLCRRNDSADGTSLPIPGDWHLHFDLDIARMFAMARLRIDPSLINPGFILDGPYVEASPGGK